MWKCKQTILNEVFWQNSGDMSLVAYAYSEDDSSENESSEDTPLSAAAPEHRDRTELKIAEPVHSGK